jgi:hypothetical protein
LEQGTASDYARYFSGAGVEHALICLTCREQSDGIEASLRDVPPERFAQIDQDGYWERDPKAILGRPQVMERPSDLSFRHEDVAFAGQVPAPIADLRPILASDHGEFLVLVEDGDLLRVDPLRGSLRRVLNPLESGMILAPKRSLHVSPGGDMAAVVESRGRSGIVLDLDSGRPTMRLDRGDYYVKHSEFPAAFFEVDGRLRLVHGTDWNRLDISDPRTGALLTDRSPTSYRRGEQRPEHYLDYFHGGLAVSPGGDWVVDNGWVWHPVGSITAWSLHRWLKDNPWESEDGPSKRGLCDRDYFWDGPLCWIDDRTVAVWGYGNDEENLIPAALLFDVESGRLVRWFAGPVGSLAFDRYLFSYSAEEGTSVWDVATGEWLLHDASFCPTAYHPGAGCFITALPGGRFRLTRLVDD